MAMNNYTTMAMNNYTDDGIVYSYTLKSDDSRYVQWSKTFDISLLYQDLFDLVPYASVIFGGLVLIHSAIINKRKMTFVRFVSDLSALCLSLSFSLSFSLSLSLSLSVSLYLSRPLSDLSALCCLFFAVFLSHIGIST
jgi:hypothetical protein